jgi:hypothetical protein
MVGSSSPQRSQRMKHGRRIGLALAGVLAAMAITGTGSAQAATTSSSSCKAHTTTTASTSGTSCALSDPLTAKGVRWP